LYGVGKWSDATGHSLLPRSALKQESFASGGEKRVALDKSLKRTGRLRRSRNVLTREERIAKMKYDDRWDEGRSPFGLPKTRVVKLVLGKKRKKKAGEEEEAAKTESKEK
jgi:small basic protein (TIGR04137 family)